jgi:hypothetical protein
MISCLPAACLTLFSSAPGQQVEIPGGGGEEVPILRKVDGRHFTCYLENEVLGEARLKEIEGDARYKACPQVRDVLRVDFSRHSLITYHVNGDCFVRAEAKVLRNNEAKKYTVRIKKIPGGCRAGGRFQGWLLIEKIPPGYVVDFVETRADRDFENVRENIFDPDSKTAGKGETAGQEILETVRFDMKSCVKVYGSYRFVVRDRETFLKTIRGDASRDYCLKNLGKIDFAKHSLPGLSFRSDYCRTPAGLTVKTVKDAAKKQYLLILSYLEPRGICRRISVHGVWVLVPKLPEDYEVVFKREIRLGKSN